MDSILSRRRLLADSAEAAPDLSIVYQLEAPRTFTGAQYVNTQISVSSISGNAFTLSAKLTTSRTSGVGRVFSTNGVNPNFSVFITLYNSRLVMEANWGSNTKLSYIDDADFSRPINVVFRHDTTKPLVNDLHVGYYDTNGDLQLKHTASAMNSGPSSSDNILTGGQSGGNSQTIEGTMYESVIRTRALTDEEIDAYLRS